MSADEPEFGHDPEPLWEPTPPTWWQKLPLRPILLGALGVLVGVGGVLGLTMALRGDTTPTSTTLAVVGGTGGGTGAGSNVTVTTVIPDVGPADLEWTAIEGTLGFVNRITYGADGAFYALSTAPGEAFQWPPPPAVYRSEDGATWETLGFEASITPRDMTVFGGGIYLIGTAPAVDPVAPTFVVAGSTDGGATWAETELSTAVAAPDLPAQGFNANAAIAASPSAMVAVTSTNYWIDWWQVVPDLAAGGEGFDLMPSQEGLAVVDWRVFEDLDRQCFEAGGMGQEDVPVEELPEPCRLLMEGSPPPVDVIPWEDLGMSGPPGGTSVFRSVDGQTWQAVDVPFDAINGIGPLHAVGNGFLLTIYGPGPVQLWYSPDGLSWSQAGDLPRFDWVVAAGSVGGRGVIIGSANNGRPTAAWQDGDGWLSEEIPLPPNSWIGSGAAGPLGVAVMAQSEGNFGPGPVTLMMATQPGNWEAIDVSAVAGQVMFFDWVAVGADAVIARAVVGIDSGSNVQLVGTPS